MNKQPLILVCNDDGVCAPGIRFLIDLMKNLGEVVVVAPDKGQSGKGHAITVDGPLTIKKLITDDGHLEYSCSGTPADCIKLALHEVLDRKPDLCVSGINHGSNASISVIYSGTMSAAIEAGIEGIPSIGFSLDDFSYDADFSATEEWIMKITSNVLKDGLPDGVVLNVNFPKANTYKGIKIARQARGNWVETLDKRVNPHGQEYFWLTGRFELMDEGEDTDIMAMKEGFVSVVPVKFDLTDQLMFERLKSWE